MSSDPDPQHWGKKLPCLSCSIRAGLSPPPWVRFISESVSEGLPREPQGIAAIRRLDSIYRNKAGRGRTIYYTVISYTTSTWSVCRTDVSWYTQLLRAVPCYSTHSSHQLEHGKGIHFHWGTAEPMFSVQNLHVYCLGPKRRSVVLQEIWLEPMKMFNKKRYLVLKFPSLLGEISPF